MDDTKVNHINSGSPSSLSTNKQSQQTQETKKSRGFYGFYGPGPGKYRYAVYPDYWKEEWGKKPLLGFVNADDEFYAEREAYNKGLLTVNYTFRPHVVRVGNYVPKFTRS